MQLPMRTSFHAKHLLRLLALLWCGWNSGGSIWAENLDHGFEEDEVLLVINSYHPGYSWTDDHLKGLKSRFSWENEHNHLRVEYLDSKRSDWGASYISFIDYIQSKYEGQRFVGLVAFDDHAFRCSVELRSVLGLNVPIFFAGVNGAIDFEDPENFDVTGVFEKITAFDSLVWALEVFPEVEHCAVIVEKSLTGEIMFQDLSRKLTEESYRSVSLSRVDNLPPEKLGDLISSLGSSSMVLVLPYFRDVEGRIVDQTTIISELSDLSSVPFIVAYQFSMSEGVVGGKVLDAKRSGELLGDKVLAFLGGTAVKDIPVETETPATWTFSAPALESFGIRSSMLPPSSLLLYSDGGDRWAWVWASLVLAVFVMLQALLIGVLLNRRKRLRQLSEELRLSRNQFSSWVIHAPLPISVFAEDGRIIEINRKFTELMGYEASDLKNIEEMWNVLIQDENERSQFINRWQSAWEARKATSVVPMEVTMTGKSGKREVLEIYVSVIGDFWICHYLEITWRSKIERELQDALNQAHMASIAKTEFLTNMSHEIRTPLNGVLGMVQLLRETQLDAEQQSYLDTVKKSGEVLLLTINDILDISKIESGQFTIETISVDLKSIIDDCVTVCLPKMRSDSVRFSHSLEPGLPLKFVGDGYRISQVIINLLSNAFKYTEKGTVEFYASAVHLGEDRYLYKVTVRDSGIGVPDDKQSTIFDPFSQADSSITRQYGGTGLGLTISRKLARRMGGDITVSSREGTGSEFVFTWLANTESESLVRADNPPEVANNVLPATGIKTLVVEDNPVNFKVTDISLRKFGIKAHKATNGQEAVDMLQSEVFDLIFMDIQMPVMDGLMATRKIRESDRIEKQPFIIALTAHALADHMNQCRDAGMNGFLAKPFTSKQLRESVDLYLRNADQNRSEVYF
jgi:PAS domain S-box-containing protein